MLVRAKGSSHQPGSVLSGWRWLFKKFPHGNFRQRHWHKNDRKEQRFYNWASFSHRATVESMCVQGFSLLLVFFSFLFLFSQLCAGKSLRDRETRCWPTRGRERTSGNHHHRQLPRLNYGYFEWTGCKRTGHTHQ